MAKVAVRFGCNQKILKGPKSLQFEILDRKLGISKQWIDKILVPELPGFQTVMILDLLHMPFHDVVAGFLLILTVYLSQPQYTIFLQHQRGKLVCPKILIQNINVAYKFFSLPQQSLTFYHETFLEN